MKKVYLVDSENVGDVWVPLLVSAKAEEEVVVFYTQRSPHMGYENVRLLKETDKEAVFIKCFEGNNALDFQLVSEMGYRLCREPDCEYIIVSNDTGFDAAVRYWSERKMPVRRLSGKECYRMLRGGRTQREADGTEREAAAKQNTSEAAAAEKEPAKGNEENIERPEEPEVAEEPAASVEEKPAVDEEPEPAADERPEEPAAAEEPEAAVTEGSEAVVAEEPEDSAREVTLENVKGESAETRRMIRELLSCIGKEYLADFHNALVAFYGKEKGKKLYLKVKQDPQYNTYRAALPKYDQKEKFDIYCHIVFSNSEYAKDEPKDFAGFLYRANSKRNNLNSLRAALTGHYGKDRGMKYYSLFKSHIKIMNRM